MASSLNLVWDLSQKERFRFEAREEFVNKENLTGNFKLFLLTPDLKSLILRVVQVDKEGFSNVLKNGKGFIFKDQRTLEKVITNLNLVNGRRTGAIPFQYERIADAQWVDFKLTSVQPPSQN